MSDTDPAPPAAAPPAAAPAEPAPPDPARRVAELEARLAELARAHEARLIRAELKSAALAAGMIDLDGLKLADLSGLSIDESGEIAGAEALLAELRRAKPWLFAAPSSSSTAAPPPPAGPARHALEMTDAEYRAARAELLKRRT